MSVSLAPWTLQRPVWRRAHHTDLRHALIILTEPICCFPAWSVLGDWLRHRANHDCLLQCAWGDRFRNRPNRDCLRHCPWADRQSTCHSPPCGGWTFLASAYLDSVDQASQFCLPGNIEAFLASAYPYRTAQVGQFSGLGNVKIFGSHGGRESTYLALACRERENGGLD